MVKSDEWVTLAGHRFSVSRRRYGKETATVFRLPSGTAYRLAELPGHFAIPTTVTYLHDVAVEDTTYKVFTAPAKSDIARELQKDPIESDHATIPVLLVAGNVRCALRRVVALDSTPLEVDDIPGAEAMPPSILEEIKRIAKTRGWSQDEAMRFLLQKAISRNRAEEKYESGPRSLAKKRK